MAYLLPSISTISRLIDFSQASTFLPVLLKSFQDLIERNWIGGFLLIHSNLPSFSYDKKEAGFSPGLSWHCESITHQAIPPMHSVTVYFV
jgi:hypothetical protein